MKLLPMLSHFAFLGPREPQAKTEPWIRSKAFLFSGAYMVAAALPNNGHHENSLFFSLSMKNWGRKAAVDDSSETQKSNSGYKEKVRIGVVGGGICGNSVAHALAKNLKNGQAKKDYEIVVLEGDPHSAVTTSLTTIGQRQLESPKWSAASAKNANSLATAAAMHVVSRKKVLMEVLRDTVTEWYVLKKEFVYKNVFPKNFFIRRQDDFDFKPPYFAMHLWKCLGPAASSEERWSLVHFLRHFLYTTIVVGEDEANRRGRHLCDLAKANRNIFLQEVKTLNQKGHDIKYNKGFFGLYRSLESAEHNKEEALEHGEEAELVEWEEAIKREPKLANLPVSPLYVVHRPNDIVSSCEAFNRAWTEEIRRMGVTFRGLSQVEKVEPLQAGNRNGYRVRCKDGATHDFDVLVLAAGVHTPLLAAQIGAGNFVPTYPLRGYSLTNFIRPPDNEKDQPKDNLLKVSFSVDSMYCTSISPYMARFAGFGEFVGYPGKDDNVPSIAPSVMSRYTKIMFKQGINGEPNVALRCYRATSPDDLPIVGEIPNRPGLFVHTGHGTLGWTTGLATGVCLAQTIMEKLGEGPKETKNNRYFEFSDGIRIERAILAPSRFDPQG